MTVEIYSDIACPWCYIGHRRFDRALSAFPQASEVEVLFRPFQLDPSLPDTPQPLKETLREKFGPQLEATLQRTASTAEQEGLDFQFDDALAVNTLTAHRLLRYALQEAGPETQRELAEKLFEAHFTNGENVADPERLADLAAAVGLNREQVRAYLASDEGTADVQDAIEQAQRRGIRAVPTFVFNGTTAVQGTRPTSAFLQTLEEVQQETVAPEETPADVCADGSCST